MSPGAKGPTIAFAVLEGRGEVTLKRAYDGPLVLAIEVITKVKLGDEYPAPPVVCQAYPIPETINVKMMSTEAAPGRAVSECRLAEGVIPFKQAPLRIQIRSAFHPPGASALQKGEGWCHEA
jgi:hypothetical protein